MMSLLFVTTAYLEASILLPFHHFRIASSIFFVAQQKINYPKIEFKCPVFTFFLNTKNRKNILMSDNKTIGFGSLEREREQNLFFDEKMCMQKSIFV